MRWNALQLDPLDDRAGSASLAGVRGGANAPLPRLFRLLRGRLPAGLRATASPISPPPTSSGWLFGLRAAAAVAPFALPLGLPSGGGLRMLDLGTGIHRRDKLGIVENSRRIQKDPTLPAATRPVSERAGHSRPPIQRFRQPLTGDPQSPRQWGLARIPLRWPLPPIHGRDGPSQLTARYPNPEITRPPRCRVLSLLAGSARAARARGP